MRRAQALINRMMLEGHPVETAKIYRAKAEPALDRVQLGLSVAGFIPGVGDAADCAGRNLFAGQVNDANLSNTQFVTNLYEGFLQRGPDAGGSGTDGEPGGLV